jgi:Carboxypeptidase regulatory-like domain
MRREIKLLNRTGGFGYPMVVAVFTVTRGKLLFLTLLAHLWLVCGAAAQQVSAPVPQPGTVIGTVTDVRDDVVPEAAVTLESADARDPRTATANDNGFFTFADVEAGVPYLIRVKAAGFTDWTSPTFTLTPGQYLDLSGVKLQIAVVVTTVVAVLPPEEVATQQVHEEEKQRALGFIPAFYAVYDPHPAPLTRKLKFELAFRTTFDPITFLGAGFIAGVDQAANTPHYQQGLAGYGQRFGANYANGLTDILIGGAILPSLLHQDPRYYVQGTGTTRSRMLHAILNPLMCRADNGHWQPNVSSMGGYLASGALANTYYPERDRGAGLVVRTAGVDVGANIANSIIQEFIVHRAGEKSH